MIDPNTVKKQFPIFKREINGHPLVFLDSAASAQKPQVVIDTMDEFVSNRYANINRGVYVLSEEATERVEQVREKVANFIGASSEEIVFTRNATESINLVAYSWARHNLKKGDVVVLTEMEHHANIVPWQILRDEIGIRLEWISVTDAGYLAWDDFTSRTESFSNDIKLVCLTHVSNVLGTVNLVKEIGVWAHQRGARILVDGAQAITNFAVNVRELDCDWYVFSGHKLYGPTGVGILFGKKELLDEMPPFMGGGDMILEVHKEQTTFREAPYKFEAGTPAIIEIIGLGAAIDFVIDIGLENIRQHTQDLLQYAYTKLVGIVGLRIYGPSHMEDRGSVISFTITGIHPHDLATILDDRGIAIRSGHHCAQPICDRYDQTAMARISFAVYNSEYDIDQLIKGLQSAIETFK